MQTSSVMRIGGGWRVGAIVCLALLLLTPACTKKEEVKQEPSVREVFQQGVDDLRQDNVEKAIEAFSRITEHAYVGAPERPQAFFYLGLIAYRAGKMDLAAENFLAALKYDPENTQARLSLGNAHFAAGRIDKAIEAWDVLAKERPNLASVHNNLGIAYIDKGNVDKAIEHLERTVALTPDNYRAQSNLASAYRKKGMTEEAEAADRKASAIRARIMAGGKAPAAPSGEVATGPAAAEEPAAPSAPATP